MFNCSVCKETVGPNVSPIRTVTGTRRVAYHNEFKRLNDWGREEIIKVDSVGTEITGTELVCPHCAEQKEVQNDNTKLLTLGGHSFQEKPAPPMQVKVMAFVVDSTLERLSHKSERAKRDATAALPLVKQTIDNNPKMVF